MTGRPAVIVEKQQNNGTVPAATDDVATASFSNAATVTTQVRNASP